VIVTIHQPEHLPWLGFCDKAARADLLVLLDVVQFRKNYFQNRNRILGPNGPMWLTVPVLGKGHTASTIRDTEIHGDRRWAEKWWRSLDHAYRATPFFERHAPFLEEVSRRPWRYLADLNETLIHHLFDALDVSCKVIRASSLPVSGARSELLLDICRRTGAAEYLAGQHGRDYLDESIFAAAGIHVRYHEFAHPVYAQAGQDTFVSHLSCVDLLFRHGPESGERLRAARTST
jgi:WbqC-like protein